MPTYEFRVHRRGRAMNVLVEAPDPDRAAAVVRNAVGPGDAEPVAPWTMVAPSASAPAAPAASAPPPATAPHRELRPTG